MKKHRIVLTGGGTGGHVYPALSIAEQLVDDPDVEAILYIGAQGKLEERLAAERHLDFKGLDIAGMPRKVSFAFLGWVAQTFKAIMGARRLLSDFRPSCVVGTGGYAAAAPLAAAMQMGVPFAVHEPDAHPGLTNRLFSRYARLVSLGMDGAREQIKSSGEILVNGNPVRNSFVNLTDTREARRMLGLDPDRPTVVVTGGSQGAKAINECVTASLVQLLEDPAGMQIIHQVGDRNLEEVQASLPAGVMDNVRYCLRAYFEDMAVVYAASDLAVSRAGAMTIAELTVTGTPSVFIPYPYAAQNHQMHNARFLESRGASCVIPQNELTAAGLGDLILSLLRDSKRLSAMCTEMKAIGKPLAAADLAEQVKRISGSYLERTG